jgi:hypothetical protein
MSAKLPAIVAASRQTAAFFNEITDPALCRGAATQVLQRFQFYDLRYQIYARNGVADRKS